MSNEVVIGCKLPHGVTFKGTQGQDITLNGMNTARVVGGHGVTRVDAEEVAHLYRKYKDWGPIATKAIFTHGTGNVADVDDIAEDLAGNATGFEGVDPLKPGAQLKPEDGQKLQVMEPGTPLQRVNPPAPVPKAAAKAAAAPRKAGAPRSTQR